MKLIEDVKILIVGLGQLGGGYAQALSSVGFEVGAIDINPESISYALENGIISSGRSSNDPEYISSFGLIISALYPHIFIDWVKENGKYLAPGTLLTDVTGVKTSVVPVIQDMLRPDCEYIPAHPMAGRETSGVKSANRDVFIGANFLITPTEKNSPGAIETCRQLAKLMGFGRISVISPEEHDEIIGFLSQLTHCIAVSLMMCSDSEKLVDFTGDSFRDLTRIAKINEVMWSELFQMNKEQLLKQIDVFSESLNKLRDTIANDDTDTMKEYMKLSTERRKLFDKRK